MSDYMSKDELKERLIYCRGLGRTSLEAVLKAMDNTPTLDEKETIRKAFEKVLENLAECTEQTYYKSVEGDLDASQRNLAYHQAIAIIKEECGINE